MFNIDLNILPKLILTYAVYLSTIPNSAFAQKLPIDGYVLSSSFDVFTKTDSAVTELDADWVVPAAPLVGGLGRTLYYWTGIANHNNNLFQPILGNSGGTNWCIQIQCTDCARQISPGCAPVNVGDKIHTTISLVSSTGTTAPTLATTYTVTITDQTTGASESLTNYFPALASGENLFDVGFPGVLEVYTIGSCGEFSATPTVTASNYNVKVGKLPNISTALADFSDSSSWVGIFPPSGSGRGVVALPANFCPNHFDVVAAGSGSAATVALTTGIQLPQACKRASDCGDADYWTCTGFLCEYREGWGVCSETTGPYCDLSEHASDLCVDDFQTIPGDQGPRCCGEPDGTSACLGNGECCFSYDFAGVYWASTALPNGSSSDPGFSSCQNKACAVCTPDGREASKGQIGTGYPAAYCCSGFASDNGDPLCCSGPRQPCTTDPTYSLAHLNPYCCGSNDDTERTVAVDSECRPNSPGSTSGTCCGLSGGPCSTAFDCCNGQCVAGVCSTNPDTCE